MKIKKAKEIKLNCEFKKYTLKYTREIHVFECREFSRSLTNTTSLAPDPSK